MTEKSKLNLLLPVFLSNPGHILPGHEPEARELSFACINLRCARPHSPQCGFMSSFAAKIKTLIWPHT